VVWTELAQHWVRRELDGLTPSAVANLMYDHVIGGGQIDQVPEHRPEWSQYEYHYDLRFVILGRRVYIETRLLFDDPTDRDDPVVVVGNIHDA
jgi:hypothetical protein